MTLFIAPNAVTDVSLAQTRAGDFAVCAGNRLIFLAT